MVTQRTSHSTPHTMLWECDHCQSPFHTRKEAENCEAGPLCVGENAYAQPKPDKRPIDQVLDFCKAEVHDGDIFMIRVKDSVPEKQMRAFRRHVFEHGQRMQFEERGILCLVVNGDVELLKAEGPLRVQPKKQWNVDRAAKRAKDIIELYDGRAALLQNGVRDLKYLDSVIRGVIQAVKEEIDGD